MTILSKLTPSAPMCLVFASLIGCGGESIKANDRVTDLSTAPVAIPSANIPASIVNGSLWDLEGHTPSPLVDAKTLVFVPLQAQYVSPNGNGWRQEYKISKDRRLPMSATQETFKATVKVDMSKGGKNIITQYHGGGLGTLMKVYVSDSRERGFMDSQYGNGIFDVYVRLRKPGGGEEKHALGTLRSGEQFTLTVVNDFGLVRVEAFGRSFSLRVKDSDAAYLKFGNYLQSQDTDGNINCGQKGNSQSFADCYARLGITESKVTMTDVSYTRKTR